MFFAGAAVTTITPPLGVCMSGDFTGRPAERVARDLTARALVLTQGSTTLALVTLDLIIVTAELAARTRALVAEQCNIPADNVMISATHTHTGPALWTVGNEYPDLAYIESLPAKILNVVRDALSKQRPARIATGTGATHNVCFNRRVRMVDGRVTMNFMLKMAGIGAGDSRIAGQSGPIDPDVSAFLIEDIDGPAIALWASIPSHHGDTDDDHALSPDYFGAFADVTSAMLGSQCVGMLQMGTSGNINTIDLANPSGVPYGDRRGRLVATSIASAALNGVALAARESNPVLASARWSFNATRRGVPATDLELARKIAYAESTGAELPEAAFSFVVGDPIPPAWRVIFARETLAVADMPENITSELQVFRIGPVAVVALPGEFFVEWGLALKARSPFAVTAIATMSNDHIGYIPTQAAMTEGGYETWTARSSWAIPETGDAVVSQVLARLEGLAALAQQ